MMRSLLVIAVLMANACSLQAQNNIPPVLKKNHWKANLYAIGISLNYEHRIARQATLNYEAELNHGFVLPQHSINGKDWAHIVFPAVSAEYRQYYNLAQRQLKNKNTTDNSGNFFSVTAGVRLPPTIARNVVHQSSAFVLPAWGLQRSVANNTNIEARAGAVVLYGFATQNIHVAPNFRISVGYVIR